MPLAIALNQCDAAWIALAGIVVFLVLLRLAGARFQALLIGADKRTSTSKLQALLWTLLLSWALLVLTLQGRTGFDLIPDYLVLLGFPALALVFAKAIVQQKLEAGDIAKPTPATGDPTEIAQQVETAHIEAQNARVAATAAGGAGDAGAAVAAAQVAADAADSAAQAATMAATTTDDKRSFFSYFGDIVNNDEGKADIVDFQYVVFNLVAATYFLVHFIGDNRLPEIPETLLALTGASAATYVTNKAVLNQKPALTGVSPASAPPGTQILLRGVNLAGAGSKPNGSAAVTEVKFDTRSAAAELPKDDGVTVIVPADVEGYVSGTPKTVRISVLNAAGLESNQIPFTIN